jgi:hypothetical protein
MSNPEIQPMMDAIGFTYSPNSIENDRLNTDLSAYPNPSASGFTIGFSINKSVAINLDIYNLTGAKVQSVINREMHNPGRHTVKIDKYSLKSGIYFARLEMNDEYVKTIKLIVK